MQTHNIPTADYGVFEDYEAACEFVRGFGRPVAVKADGLTAGKGVIVCGTGEEAEAALKLILVDRAFGEAGNRVVIEERLVGREISVLAFCDGQTAVPMPVARDHKRVYDHDQGPNTGGMGAFAPTPDISPALVEQVRRSILQPVIDGMRAQGTPYKGVLYAGLMLVGETPYVLEFNCRFGDPETQVILPLLESDLFDVAMACIQGRLAETTISWRKATCATVVLASPGYPSHYPKGLPITGADETPNPENTIIFHAGTARQNGRLVTVGGRVLAVTAVKDNLAEALKAVYDRIAAIHFDGMHFRRDIGKGGKG